MRQPPLQAARERYAGVWALAARLTPRGYLLFHLAVGLVVTSAAILFLRLARGIAGDAMLARFDLALANALYRATTPEGVHVFIVITALGGMPGLLALGLAVAAVLALRGAKLLLIGWIVAVAGGGLLNLGLKALFRRTRPVFAEPPVVLGSWSFPSGHAMSTFVAAGALAYLLFLVLRSPVQRVIVVIVALLWVLLIGFSRMYLGVHYFSDVIAGYVAGTVWLGAWISGMEIARRIRVTRNSSSPGASAPGTPTVM